MDNLEYFINNLDFVNIFWQITATLIFMGVDFLSGFIQAIINKNVDSQKLREGLLRKSMLVLVIILSFIVHYTFNISYISKVVCIYIILMEIISILENFKKAGIEFGKLSEIIKLKQDEEEK